MAVVCKFQIFFNAQLYCTKTQDQKQLKPFYYGLFYRICNFAQIPILLVRGWGFNGAILILYYEKPYQNY